MPLSRAPIFGATMRNVEEDGVSNDEDDMQTSICDAVDEDRMTAVGNFVEETLPQDRPHVPPTTVEIPSATTHFFSHDLSIIEQLVENEPTEREHKIESESAEDSISSSKDFGDEEGGLPFVDEIEIEFVTDDHAQPINSSLIADRGDAPSPLSLFQDSWNYPSSIAMILDDGS